jgi:hypothetical protein
MSSNLPTPPASKAMLGTGRVISGLAALFLLMDGTMKLFKPSFVVGSGHFVSIGTAMRDPAR